MWCYGGEGVVPLLRDGVPHTQLALKGITPALLAEPRNEFLQEGITYILLHLSLLYKYVKYITFLPFFFFLELPGALGHVVNP